MLTSGLRVGSVDGESLLLLKVTGSQGRIGAASSTRQSEVDGSGDSRQSRVDALTGILGFTGPLFTVGASQGTAQEEACQDTHRDGESSKNLEDRLQIPDASPTVGFRSSHALHLSRPEPTFVLAL